MKISKRFPQKGKMLQNFRTSFLFVDNICVLESPERKKRKTKTGGSDSLRRYCFLFILSEQPFIPYKAKKKINRLHLTRETQGLAKPLTWLKF